jgi:hypothetical protein
LPDQTDKDSLSLLHNLFDDFQLELAGPRIGFDPAIALAAAGLVHNASWFLLSRGEPQAVLEQLLVLPGPPRSPSEHLSADLLLRFLPQIHRRAKANNPADRLSTLLAEVLRVWPLSGVLADLENGPITALDFGGHPGLQMLYAERFSRHEKLAWAPPLGRGLEFVELVYDELGKDLTPLLNVVKSSDIKLAVTEEEKGDE